MARARANIMPKAVRPPRSPSCGARSSARSRRSVARPRVQARCTSRRRRPLGKALRRRADVSARFSLASLRGALATKQSSRCMRPFVALLLATTNLIHHQEVEHDHRRQREDYRPYAERPQDILPGKGRLFEIVIVLTAHDAPAFLVVKGTISGEF